MKPIVKEFQDDVKLTEEVQTQINNGVSADNLYVISHDDDRTKRVADHADANTVGVNEEGLGTTVKNVFRKKGDELRVKFEELGFSKDEAAGLEEKLDHGKILLLIAS